MRKGSNLSTMLFQEKFWIDSKFEFQRCKLYTSGFKNRQFYQSLRTRFLSLLVYRTKFQIKDNFLCVHMGM